MKIRLRGPLENAYDEKKPKSEINLTPRGEVYARNYNFGSIASRPTSSFGVQPGETIVGITPISSFDLSGVFSSTTSNSVSIGYTNPISGVITDWVISHEN